MGSASHASDADRNLSGRLAARGIQVRPSWLHQLRSEHEIPGPILIHADPGCGRRGGLYRYSAEAEDFAAEKLQLLGLRPDLTSVNLAQFGAGRCPDVRALKHAYDNLFQRWERLLLRERQPGAEALDIAESVMTTYAHGLMHSDFTREMVNRVRRRTRARLPSRVRRKLAMPARPLESAVGTVESAVTQTLVIGWSGAASSDETLDEFIDASGISAMAEDQWKGLGPISPHHPSATLRLVFKHARFSRLKRRVRAASMPELVEARDTAALFLTLLLDARTVIRFITPLPDAFGFALLTPRLIRQAAGPLGTDLVVGLCVPMILLISDLFPAQYRESVALFSHHAPVYRAMASCFESLPAELRGVHGARRLRRLPQSEQRRLIMDWARAHPEHAMILGIDSNAP
jgi:hypothetical protein